MTDTGSKRPPLVDQEARSQAIRNLSENLWVEAGAGTGKTTLLIERLLRIVTEGAARLEQVAAITFTEKAAAELKARLREKLEQLAVAGDNGKTDLIYQALDEIETAPICTIHSFAASLLREKPVEAGLDPRFVVADTENLDDLLDQAWEQWLSSELQKEAAPLRRALNYGCTVRQLVQLGKLLYHHRDLVWESDIPDPSANGVTAFIKLIKSSQAELSLLLNDCKREDDQGYQYLQTLDKQLARLLETAGQEDQERFLLQSLQKISAKGRQENWDPKESCRRQKEICKMLDQNLAAVRQNLAAGLVADLSRWFKDGYLIAVEEFKREHGILDFQDLLLRCRNLLRDSIPARRYFQERFQYLLVDEFQDTDPLQVDLVFLLAEEEPLARHWKEVEPKAGKLFLVGDPKQSIYRFRRADIEIYQAAKDKVLEKGRLLNITQNFRTVQPLIEWVNCSFGSIIQHQENYQPAYQNLSAYRKDSGEPAMIVLTPAVNLEALSADQVRVNEAEAVAALIAQMVGNRTISQDNHEKRVLKYSDIALLFPTTTGLEHYEEALRRQGIPYRLEGGKRFYQQAEIIALKNLLSAIDNPYDRVALVAVLRYWGGVSDEELFLFKEDGGELSYLSDAGNDYPGIRAVLALLKEAHLEQHSMSLSALVGDLLNKTWFWQRSVLDRRSRQVQANLRKVIQLIRAREQEQPVTLKGFTKWLDQAWSDKREEQESLLHDPGGNTVQILTIHRAKGLEFPAVFLLNAGGGSRFGEPFIADRAENRYYLRFGGDFISTGYNEALEKEKLRQEAERKRLLYVAATRARDYFILPRFHNSSNSGFWTYFDEVENRDCLNRPGCLVLGEAEFKGQYLKVIPTRKSGVTEPGLLLKQRHARLAELESTYAMALRPSPSLSVGELTDAFQWQEEQTRAVGDDGISFGSAFHQVMETVDLVNTEPADLEDQVMEAARYWAVDDREGLTVFVKNALKHPLLERLRQASSYYREMPFTFNLAGRVIEGIVDLLFVEDGSLVIVDYKTDLVSGELLEKRWQHYKRQGQIYAMAMAEITGFPVKEISFYFVRNNTVKTILEPDFELLKAEIIAIIEKMLIDS